MFGSVSGASRTASLSFHLLAASPQIPSEGGTTSLRSVQCWSLAQSAVDTLFSGSIQAPGSSSVASAASGSPTLVP
jgi:hypothetical protein